jgi:hypothetical protein
MHAWLQYVNTGTAKNITIIAGVVAAILYLNGALFRPFYDSGPLPFPARAEVDKLRVEAQKGLADTNMALSEIVEVAKAARIEAQQAVQQNNDGRAQRLLGQKIELEARLKIAPNDTILRDAYARTITDLAKVTAQPVTSSTTTSAPDN